MAEVVLRERFADAGLDAQVVVDSTGISDEERGNPIDRRAQAVLVEAGYPAATEHRARQTRASELGSRDLVLAMTSMHAQALRRLGSEQVRMYRSFDPDAPVGRAEHALDVDDPWYGGAADFEACLAQVEAAADGIVAYVRQVL